MILDNAIGDRQPQTRTLADVFGSEKGIEDILQVCSGNADTLVCD
jgi:hypothetical protein